MSRDGTKTSRGLIYIQPVSAEGAFMAMGFYQSEPADLAALRQAMVAAPKDWTKLEARLAKAGLALGREEALQRLPKGFEAMAGSPVAEALKLRNLIVRRPLTPAQVQRTELVEEVVAFAISGLPLLRFGWEAFANAKA